MTNIALFDRELIGIDRLAKKFALHLNKKKEKIIFTFYYIYAGQKQHNQVIKSLPNNSELIQIKSLTDIELYLISKQTKIAITFAQRPEDSYFTYIAKKNGCQTFQYQHGIYIPYMKRMINYWYTHLFFLLRTLVTSIQLSYELKKNHSPVKILIGLIFKYLFGKHDLYINYVSPFVNSDKVYIYGDYWKDYYSAYFGYLCEQFICVGYEEQYELYQEFNSRNVSKLASNNSGISVLYICQTLVEDGRLSQTEFKKFIQELEKISQFVDLIIKPHPRSDMNLYQKISKFSIIENDKQIIDISRHKQLICIGHYSSYIAKVHELCSITLLYEFKNHHLPECIKIVSDFHTNSLENLNSFVKKIVLNPQEITKIKQTKTKQNYSFFYFNPSEHPMDLASKEIFRYLIS